MGWCDDMDIRALETVLVAVADALLICISCYNNHSKTSKKEGSRNKVLLICINIVPF